MIGYHYQPNNTLEHYYLSTTLTLHKALGSKTSSYKSIKVYTSKGDWVELTLEEGFLFEGI